MTKLEFIETYGDVEVNLVSYRSFVFTFHSTLLDGNCILICVDFSKMRESLYMMAGGYAAQSVVESEIGDKVYTLINQELDKLITQEK